MNRELFDEKLNQREAAKALHVSPRTLERWRLFRCGPPYLKLGGRVCYLESDIAAYLLAHVVKPSTGAGTRTRFKPTADQSAPDFKSLACGRDED